ncbi:MAG: CHAT domain-containing protein [Alphaproteobacteria bacterium]|nr:CHAT domain-containing protein [Alphaproteobacteria bacterium]
MRVLGLAGLLLLLAACGPGSMSVEEAKETVARFQAAEKSDDDEDDKPGTLAALEQGPAARLSGVTRRRADAKIPDGLAGEPLVRFFLVRGVAARDLGRLRQAFNDLEKARDLAREASSPRLAEILFEYYRAHIIGGQPKVALASISEAVSLLPRSDFMRVTQYRKHHAWMLQSIGRLEEAERSASIAEETARERGNRIGSLANRSEKIVDDWVETRAHALSARAMLLGARGKYAEQEGYWRTAIQILGERANKGARTWSCEMRGENLVHNLVNQNRLIEAEAEALSALACLQSADVGLRWDWIANTTKALAIVLEAQGRLAEAEAAARKAIEFQRRTGSGAGGASQVPLARALAAQERWRGAAEVYGRIETLYAGDPVALAQILDREDYWHLARIRAGRPGPALAILAVQLAQMENNLGPDHERTATLRALVGMAEAALGRRERGVAELGRAVPVLLKSRAAQEGGEASSRQDRILRHAIDAYLAALAATKGQAAAGEAFVLAQHASGRVSQRALAQAGARLAARDPALAQLARQEQDASRGLAALEGLIASLAGTAEPGVLDARRADAASLRRARDSLRGEMAGRFPAYAAFLDPQPLDIAAAQAALKPGQALVATHVGPGETLVWVVPKTGAAGFSAVPIGREEMTKRVEALRSAMTPKGSTLGDVADYDLAAAHDLYVRLLRPFEGLLRQAKTLVVAADGPLAALPFAMLATAPTPAKGEERLLFAGYRAAPFLIRTHAIAQVPTVASLATLAALPRGSSKRAAFLGFGDPVFERTASVAPGATRGLALRSIRQARGIALNPVDNQGRNVGVLAPLPDTADELRAIARTVGADPNRDVILGVAANEETVRKADLLNRRVVAFATHGLIPGDIAGLNEPALALTPAAAGGAGDGLLRVSEIATLKMDADWVILSACNTGTAGGAEAVSGLGRAFFYAGARSVLVTQWAVETSSAKALTTGLFEEQRKRPQLSRAEVLRRGMLRLLEDGAFVGADGRAVFAYAHPIFWAPFTLVGDPG